MRKNVKKQLALRVLSTAALMAMVSSIATAAFAEEYDLNKGSVTVETKDNGNTYVTQANTETTDHLDTTGVTITSNGEQTSNTITVNTADNQTTNVTLQDVNIKEDQWSGGAAMTINGKGDTALFSDYTCSVFLSVFMLNSALSFLSVWQRKMLF